ncbi:Glycyl-tRNA synthetase beta chain (EC [Olavius algarvensis associated proteobacterium Delta 3]|nr:Glycyl-tRNA synthetase beta chain (EC [Olavius algarvensis associated proteobacterium Delta 3]CAB5139216.1 Glycyl-tRNA synthetase beta chain (EC [Olavius algarvensis associated proteobacterium Delta 3]
MEKLLLEIGSEEIPAGYIQPALDALAANLTKRLTDARIDHGETICFGTPRRLAVMVADVALKQRSLTTEMIGPPEKVGYDESGKPTVAAEKFAEKIGVPLSKVSITETEKGRYLSATVTERGRATRTFLKTVLPDIILATPFPKRMRWADFSIEFARPIHSILALLGDKIISFSVGNIKSGRYAYGHYFMSPAKIKIAVSAQYVDALRSADVVVDISERKQLTAAEVDKAASSAGGEILRDDELLDIVTNLVELPLPVVGRFETKFLELPSEILITAMREHQKYFAVVDGSGSLMPCFIAVNNTRTRDMNLVATGHERVIRARLEDARFFYHADLKSGFDQWLEALKGVLFQAKLGTMHEKVLRVQKISEALADAIGVAPPVKDQASRAALLCKADLVTEVVGEFPKLQGVMGRVYATVKNEPHEVATAIEEHYRPVRSGGQLPDGTTGAIVSIADKVDSICGCFCVGLIPTGGADPYALRRQGIGIIQIMLQNGFACSVHGLIEQSLSLFGDKMETPAAPTTDRIFTFLKNRMAHLLAEEGYAKDVIAAVLDVSADVIPDAWNRVRALDELKKAPDFEPLAAAFKRVVNIIRQADAGAPGDVDPSRFEHDSESSLHAAYRQVSASVSAKLDNGQFDAALKEIVTLKDPVDTFFDGVMVLAEDPAVRANRLALLREIAALFGRFADFSKISI